MEIVRVATGHTKVEPAHRLDKPVSGVLLLGKSKRQAAKLLAKIQMKDSVEKMYVARVQRVRPPAPVDLPEQGRSDAFPVEPFVVAAPMRWVSSEKRAVVVDPDSVISSEGDDAAALATTRFHQLCELPDGTVLVDCRPLTGQRHQIRAHLAHIGWPIANDTVYAGPHPPDPQEFEAYKDDEDGTLSKMYSAPERWRDWCPKCEWTRQQISSEVQLARPEIDKTIWLHAHRYVYVCTDAVCLCIYMPAIDRPLSDCRYQIPDGGIDVKAPLPPWAGAAADAIASNEEIS